MNTATASLLHPLQVSPENLALLAGRLRLIREQHAASGTKAGAMIHISVADVVLISHALDELMRLRSQAKAAAQTGSHLCSVCLLDSTWMKHIGGAWFHIWPDGRQQRCTAHELAAPIR